MPAGTILLCKTAWLPFSLHRRLNHFMTASGAFGVLEKLHLTAAGVLTLFHQTAAAGVALVTHKGLLATVGTDDLERPAAT